MELIPIDNEIPMFESFIESLALKLNASAARFRVVSLKPKDFETLSHPYLVLRASNGSPKTVHLPIPRETKAQNHLRVVRFPLTETTPKTPIILTG